MNKHLRLIYLLLLLLGLNIQTIRAQTDFASEEDLKKQAAKLFNEEEYEKAYPLYSQLVSLYRKDPSYNYRLGVCMLYASDEKERSITFLEFATKNKDVEKEAFFFLAKAYHLNYRFDDAIGQYLAYKKMASSAKIEKFQVDRQIEMCNNGKTLLRYITDLPVLGKTEIGREDFFRSYDISEIGGKILVKPDEKEFRTALDKKKKETSILYLAANSNQIYFSSYGDNEQNGKDIFLMKKTASGEWDKPQKVGNVINTKYDEDFPFLHPNGKVMYFCSKGHNSMGGYDIFKTTLNQESNLWGEPENMDFPINTPDDDILYITNADEKKAFFASGRSSIAGKIAVYHINVERRPIDFVIIKGAVIKNRKDQALTIKITVKNVNDNGLVGIYNATSTGAYDIKLPNGGSYLFTVETADFATQSEVVTVPVQTDFRPMKQEISFEIPTDKLLIKNLFNEAVNDSNYLLAINIIKEKSKLDVTPTAELSMTEAIKQDSIAANEAAIAQTTTKKTTATATTTTTTTPKTSKALSNDDIIRIAYRDASIVDTEATTAREQADIAMSFANQKNEQAQSRSKQAAELMDAASKEQDNVKKQVLTDEANAARKDTEKLNSETVVAFNLAKKIDATAIAKREEADLSQQYAVGLEAAVNSKNSAEATVKLEELEKKLEALSLINADRFPVLNSYKKEEENKKRELDEALKASNKLKNDIADNKTIINNLKEDSENARNSQVKQGINNQFAELELENISKQKEYEQNEIKIARIEKEYNSIKNEAELVGSVVDKSKTSTSEAAAATIASIDKNKLEQQVNSIKSSEENSDKVAAANVAGNNTVKANSDSVNTSPAVTNTSAKAFSDMNKEYAADLKKAQKIKDKDDREKEKATVLMKWSDAIDADVAKQKADYISESDPKVQSLLAKRISDAENSSKEKRTQADESLAKVKPQAFIAATTISTNTKNNVTTAKNADTTSAVNIAKASTTTNGGAENQFVYNQVSAKEDITKAKLVNKQADTLATYSVDLKTKATEEKNPETKKIVLEQSEEMLEQSKEKKIQALQLNSNANKTEYASNKVALNNLAKSYTTNTSDDILLADMNNDEALIYFDKAQKLHLRADTTRSLDQKAILLEDASKNEILALEKQKKSAEIYKNHKESAATITLNTPSVELNKTTVTSNTLPVNNGTSETAKITETALLETENSSTNKQTQTDPNVNKSDILKQQDVGKTNDNESTKKQFPYTDPAAGQQMEQANALNKEANDLLAQSLVYKLETVDKTSVSAKKERKKQGDELVLRSQDKRMQAFQLVTTANKTEYTSNQNQIDQLAKASSNNTSPDLFKAKILNDESKKYFDNAQEQRKKAGLITSYYPKEKVLKDAQDSEMIALEKQKEAFEIYKSYNPNFVTSAISKDVASTTKTSETTGTGKITSATVNLNAYTEPVAKEQILKADQLNKESDEVMGQSIELKSQAVKSKNIETKNVIYAESEELMKEGQDKKLRASQLTGSANTAEFDSNQNQLNQLEQASSSNTSPEILKAEITNDEAKAYFDEARKQRVNAGSIESYAAKETELEKARKNEMSALEKQKEAMDIYKKYNPNFVASSGSAKITPATVNQNAYTEPVTKEQILKADQLNKEADEVMGQSIELKSQAVKSKNIETKNVIYAESEELMKEGQDKKLRASQLTGSANTAEFDSNQNQLNQLEQASSSNTSPEILKAEITNDEAKAYFDEARKQRVNAGSIESYAAKETELEKARKNEMSALEKQKEAMDIYKKYNPNFVASSGSTTANNNIKSTVSGSSTSSTSTNMGAGNVSGEVNTNGEVKAVTLVNTTLPVNETIVNTNKTYTNAEVILTANEVFEQRSNLPPYSPSNPIPINNKLPEGLIFKVQIGAFRKAIPQDLFQGMIPITGETAPQGFIRYTAGLFEKFATADKIRAKIIAMGYKDAFIVAFLNGKRIPINEAYAMAEGIPATVLQINNPAEKIENNVVATTTVQVTNEEPTIVKTESVTSIQGLFYTVQIGVFSQPVVAGKLYNMKPLYTETAENGNLRYYTGIYKSVSRAAEATEMINDVGIKDAFVTAYYNGKRISLAEAKQYEKQGDGVFTTGANVNKLPVFTADPKQNQVRKASSDLTINGQPAANNANQTGAAVEQGIIYKVQIGAFNEEVPLEIANKFIKIASKGIKTYTDNTGLTVYTVGNVKTYEEAILVKAEVVAESLTDAFIVAYQNGEKIPVEEARQVK